MTQEEFEKKLLADSMTGKIHEDNYIYLHRQYLAKDPDKYVEYFMGFVKTVLLYKHHIPSVSLTLREITLNYSDEIIANMPFLMRLIHLIMQKEA